MALSRIRTDDQDLQLVQDRVDQALTPIQNGALVNARAVAATALTTSVDNLVAHGLSYTPSIVLISNPNANATIWVTSIDANYLHVSCSADVTAGFVVS